MAKNEKTTIMIDDIEYKLEDMKPEEQLMINHIADLDRKLSNARFNVDQLQVGRDAFMSMLKKSLDEPVEVVEE